MKSSIIEDLNKADRILFFGFGNPGRKDDGLGIMFTDKLEKWVNDNSLHSIDFDANYQLNIEDAYTISKYDMVVFADASIENLNTFDISRIEPSDKVNFSTHSVSPSFVAHLCKEIYGKTPIIYLLHIKGYEWNLEEGFSIEAKNNLKQSLYFFEEMLRENRKNTRSDRKNKSLVQNHI